MLHPELLEFLKITRKLFPVGNINLVTNGVLISKMTDEFWDTIKKYDIVLRPTKYPVAVDYDAIEKKAMEKEIKFKYFGSARSKNSWIHTVIAESGLSNENDSFLLCGNANSCSVLRDGKIYPCPRAAKIEIFNKYFNTDFKITKNDYIDIYEDICLEDIMRFLARPIPFCRYCEWSEYNPTGWEQSKRQIGEWT